MSLATELNRILNAKADIKTAIETKGVVVSEETLIDGYADLIDDIVTDSGTDISDADAAVGDVLSSKTFYSVEEPIKTGTMTDRGTVSTDITTVAQEVTIAAGKHSGSGVVKIDSTEQAKIIAENIKDGITILSVEGTLESGGSYSRVVQQLTTSDTWTKPTGLIMLQVICIGGGGGGSSGSKQAEGVASLAGPGGSPGCIAWHNFIETDLSATENYVIGAGGAGGASVSVNSTTQNAGSDGGDSSFSTLVVAKAGKGATTSSGGQSVTSNNVPVTNLPVLGGGSRSSSGGAGSAATSNSLNYPWTHGGGGGGGGVTSANVANIGNSGARLYDNTMTLSATNGRVVNTDGGDGVAGAMNRILLNFKNAGVMAAVVFYSTSGGGGGGSIIGNAGRGGDGGNYGGAGGGGGAARNDVGNSGRGGNGSAGCVILIEHKVS